MGLIRGLIGGLVETRPVLITSRSPTEASSRSLITALALGSVLCLITTLVFGLFLGWGAEEGLGPGLYLGLIVGVVGGLNNGGWFVLLQKVVRRRLARAGNLPPRPADFLEWGIEQQIFRRVGGGVRFRHNLIQQQLVNVGDGKQPSPIVGKRRSPRQHSFVRRTFLLYNPHTSLGWILHTLFYMFSSIFWFLFLIGVSVVGMEFGIDDFLLFTGIFLLPTGIVLLILQRLARRSAACNAAQLEEPDA